MKWVNLLAVATDWERRQLLDIANKVQTKFPNLAPEDLFNRANAAERQAIRELKSRLEKRLRVRKKRGRGGLPPWKPSSRL